jgi:hypothetical protein
MRNAARQPRAPSAWRKTRSSAEIRAQIIARGLISGRN